MIKRRYILSIVVLTLSILVGDFVLFNSEKAVSHNHESNLTTQKVKKPSLDSKLQNPPSQKNFGSEKAENLASLENKISAFFADIPDKKTLANLEDREVHETPVKLKQAAEMLGEMREVFETRNWPPNIELEFYLRCSQEPDFFTPVKALCAARVSKIYYQRTGKLISPDIFDEQTALLKDQL